MNSCLLEPLSLSIALALSHSHFHFHSHFHTHPPSPVTHPPPSGNTWGRLLLEYATGVYSGSVYNDPSLLKALPGEFACNRQVRHRQ